MADPGPWNVGGTANSLADAIRRQAAAQSKQADQKSGLVSTQNTDPLAQLMQQIQGINTPATPYDVLLQQAQGSVGAQYDPLIAQLKGEISSTKGRAAKNEKTAKSMYGDLAKDIAAEIPDITNQMAQSSKEAQGQYDATQQALQGEYQKNAQAQNELYKQLGIQAAAPEASQQAMEDQAYFQQQSKSDEANVLQALREMGQSDVAYQGQMADNTQLAGTNAAQDIANQLEEYLQGANAKLGGYEAGKQSSIAAALAQLQQQDQARVDKQNETQYQHMMDLFNLQLKMQQMQNESSNASNLFKGTNGPAGASNVLGSLYGNNDTFSSNAIMSQINDLMANPNVIAGKYDSGQKDQYGKEIMNPVTDAYLADMLRKQMTTDQANTPLSGTQFSNADINNAIMALMAYQGKLK